MNQQRYRNSRAVIYLLLLVSVFVACEESITGEEEGQPRCKTSIESLETQKVGCAEVESSSSEPIESPQSSSSKDIISSSVMSSSVILSSSSEFVWPENDPKILAIQIDSRVKTSSPMQAIYGEVIAFDSLASYYPNESFSQEDFDDCSPFEITMYAGSDLTETRLTLSSQESFDWVGNYINPPESKRCYAGLVVLGHHYLTCASQTEIENFSAKTISLIDENWNCQDHY